MNHLDEPGVSEIIGAVLLVSLVIAGMGMIGVIMYSTPPPQSLKVVSLSASCCKCIDGTGTHYLVLVNHNGGDQLEGKDIRFFVNNQEKDVSKIFSGMMNLKENCKNTSEGAIWTKDSVLNTGNYTEIIMESSEIQNEREISIIVNESRRSARGPYLESAVSGSSTCYDFT